MESEKMIKPCDEILFCSLCFNEVYSFIKNGLPDRFESLLKEYPKLKVYYSRGDKKFLYENSKDSHPCTSIKLVGERLVLDDKKVKTDNGDEYEFIGFDNDNNRRWNKIVGTNQRTGMPLYEKEKNEYYELDCLKWNREDKGGKIKVKEEVEEHDVFEAVSIFFHICEFAGGVIPAVLEESLQVITLQKNIKGKLPSIVQQAEPLFTQILGCFNLNESCQNDFSVKINKWLQTICGTYSGRFNRKDIYGNVNNALNLYRDMRNAVSHDSKLLPMQRDTITFSLYLCILVVYLCLRHNKKNDNTEIYSRPFKEYLESLKDKENVCKLKCKINSSEKLWWGQTEIQKADDDFYYLDPFTDYTLGGMHFDLDWECQGVEISITGGQINKRVKIYQIIKSADDVASRIIFQELKKESADHNQLLLDRIDLLNNSSDKLTEEVCRLRNYLLETLQNNRENFIHDFLAPIDEIKETLKEQTKKHDKLIEQTAAVRQDLHLLIEKGEEEEGRRNAKKKQKIWIYSIVGSIAFIALLIVSYYQWYNTAEKTFAREDYELAYKEGHPDAAYEYACQLEDEKKYEEAAAWYKKAQTVYDNRLKAEETAGTSDIKSRIRLAQMYLRGKGGVSDPRKAFSYLVPIKNTKEGIGLYVYCCMYDGEKLQEAVDQLSYAEKIAPDEEYVLLTKSLVRLMMPSSKEKRTEENCAASWKTLEQLAAKESEVREEALFCMALLYLRGYYKEDEALHYNLYKGMDCLRAAAFEGKSIGAQVMLGEYLCRLYSFEDGYHAFDVAYRNGMVDALTKMFDVAVAMGQSEKADSLRNAYTQKAQADPFFRNVFDLEKRESRQAWLYQKEAFAAFDPVRHWINAEFIKNYVRNGLKTNISVDTILKIDPSLDRNYVKAIKYAQGYGVEKNQALADSLILLAVKDGLPDAIYTWGRLLDQRGKTLEAIAMLRKTADFDSRAAEWLAHIYRDIDWQRAKEYLAKMSDPSRAYKQVIDFWVWGSHFKDMTLWVDDNQAPSWADKLERELCIQLGVYQDVASISFLAGELACYYASRREPDDVIAFYIGMASRLGKEGYFSCLELSFVYYFIGRLDISEWAFMEFCIGYFRMNKPENISMAERREIVEYLRAYYPHLEEPLKKELGFDFTKGIERTDKKNPIIRFARTIQPNDPIYKY